MKRNRTGYKLWLVRGMSSFLGGSVFLCLVSGFQKIWIGAPVVLKGFVVPFVFGGIAGAIIGLSFLQLRQYAAELQQSQERYRLLFESAPDGTDVLDLEGRIVECSRSESSLLGYTKEELVGKSFFALLEPASVDICRSKLSDLQLLKPAEAIIKVARKDGSIIDVWRKVIPLVDVDGELSGMLGYNRDITERKQMEDALRGSEERFRRMAENAPDVVFRWSVERGLEFINPAVYEVTGYTPEELLADPWRGFTLATGHDPLDMVDYRAASTGEVPAYAPEFCHVRKDGSSGYLVARCSVLRDEEGGVKAIEGILRDVNATKIAEEKLRGANLIVENSPVMLFRWQAAEGWPVELASENVSQIGYSAEDFLTGRVLYASIVHPDDLERVAREVAEYSAQGVSRFRQEYRIVTPDGKVRWTDDQTVVERDANGNSTHYQGIVIDVTERKQAEVERERLLSDLVRRRTQLLTATEISKSASTILDPAELIGQTVNLIQDRFGFYYVGLFLVDSTGGYAELHAGSGEAGSRMLQEGHKLAVGGESMIGRCVAHGEARIALDVGEESVRFENPYLPQTRSEMALPLNSRGECIGALTVQSSEEAAFSEDDIAALQAMADQLAIAINNAWLYDEVQRWAARLEGLVAERTAHLSAVNKELESFAYAVSHDLRAPLRSIDGFSRALLEDYESELDAVGQDYLRRVRAASRRMGRLIDDLLKLSRLTRMDMHREAVNLSSLVQTVAADLRELDPERKVKFVIPEGIVANGDPRLLKVVFANVLGNAWKFTSKRPRARIEFGVTECDGEAAYFVRDDGAGFDMAYVDKLFGAFQRLHSVVEFEGTGIGLATVQRIINRHGGKVWVEGAVEQGATLYFTLGAVRGAGE